MGLPMKMLFNLDTSKEAQKMVFSHEKIKTTHGTIFFNNLPIVKENVQKHLDLLRDTKLKFLIHLNEKIKKANKGISITKKLKLPLPRSTLITIYKSFVRPHLDYGDIMYDQPNNASLVSNSFTDYDWFQSFT